MSKHTPGPWAVKFSKYESDVLLVQAGMPSNRVLARFGGEDEPLDEAAMADAALIAAAPDLLNALRGLMAWCAGDVLDLPEVNAARAAIAKAEGR